MQEHAQALRWAGIVVGGLALAFLVHGWWSLFLTILVVGLFEAAIGFAVARGQADGCDRRLPRRSLEPDGSLGSRRRPWGTSDERSRP